MDATTEQITDAVPVLAAWLRRVFWVMGGYIATTGILVVYVAVTGLVTGDGSALAVLTVAGVTSLGWMSVVNFMIRSDFRWALLVLDGVRGLGLLLTATAR